MRHDVVGEEEENGGRSGSQHSEKNQAAREAGAVDGGESVFGDVGEDRHIHRLRNETGRDEEPERELIGAGCREGGEEAQQDGFHSTLEQPEERHEDEGSAGADHFERRESQVQRSEVTTREVDAGSEQEPAADRTEQDQRFYRRIAVDGGEKKGGKDHFRAGFNSGFGADSFDSNQEAGEGEEAALHHGIEADQRQQPVRPADEMGDDGDAQQIDGRADQPEGEERREDGRRVFARGGGDPTDNHHLETEAGDERERVGDRFVEREDANIRFGEMAREHHHEDKPAEADDNSAGEIEGGVAPDG